MDNERDRDPPCGCYLVEKSYKAHLMDAVPLHVDQAKAADGEGILASICQGDARSLDFESDS